jgi:hypothetical protein
VLDKHGPLYILEVGSGVRQTLTPGHTGGGIRCKSNTDPWTYWEWDQVLDKHRPLDILGVGSCVIQTQTPEHVGGGFRC